MKRIKKTLTLVSMAVLLLTACESPKELGVVPYPQYAQTTSKTVELPSTVTFSTNLAKSDMNDLLAYLPDFAIPMKLVNKNPFVTIEITDATDNPIAAEGYNLTVSKQGVNIQASSAAGAFYGLQTLAQLARNGKELPVTTIKDEPRFPYRGLHLDVSRHFFNTDYVKKQIDLVATYKINRLHWHLTDGAGWRIEIKKYPELAEIGGQLPNNGRKGGYYTQEEFKDLVNYANERFITIIPEVDIPGHTAAIFAAYPDFKNAVKFKTNVNIPGQAFNALDVDDPKAMQFTEDVIAELAALAPGNYIHIGGDEAIGLPHDKFVRFINKTREIVLKNGKKMVGWQETARADISEGDVIQHWIYLKQKNEDSSKKKDNIPAEYKEIMALFAEFMKEAPKDPGLGISKKAKVILSPSGYVYLDHKYLEPSADSTQNAEQERLGMAAYEKQTIQEMYDWDPMTFNPTVENPQKDVAGIEAAIWCETITNFRDLQFLLMPRLAGVAEKGWSKVENTHWDEYKVRLGAQAPLWEKADWNYFKSSLVDWK